MRSPHSFYRAITSGEFHDRYHWVRMPDMRRREFRKRRNDVPESVSARRWLWLLIAAAALALAAFGVGRAAAHSTAARVVDDDKAQCPDAQYTTIQAAVDAASPGATIEVCAGSYSSTN